MSYEVPSEFVTKMVDAGESLPNSDLKAWLLPWPMDQQQ